MRKNFLYELTTLAVRLYAGLMLKMDIKRLTASLPAGPKIYVANHPSASDPFLIHCLDGMSVLITENAFASPLLGMWLRGVGQIAVKPGGGALEQAAQLIRTGRSVGIFPEGTYSPQTGGFGKMHSGASRLALATGAPVIPVGIYLPRERNVRVSAKLGGRDTVGYWYLSGPYMMTVGSPMRFEGDVEDRARVASVTEDIFESIRSLAEDSEMRMRSAFNLQMNTP